MEKKLVSIIVPVYNIEDYIETCINSILNQTYKNFELIIVDDGSNDNSGNICDEFKKKDPRIFVYHKENGGLSDARNFGISKVNGDYVTTIDGDDFVEETYIENLVNLLIKNDADISITNRYVFLEDEANGIKRKELYYENILDSKVFNSKKYEYYIFEDKIPHEAWGKLYKRELFYNNKYQRGLKVYEDLEFMLRLLKKKNIKIVYDPQKYDYYYRKRNNSIMNSEYNNYWEEEVNYLYNLKKDKYYKDFNGLIEDCIAVKVIRNFKKISKNRLEICLIKKLRKYLKSISIFKIKGKKNKLVIFLIKYFPNVFYKYLSRKTLREKIFIKSFKKYIKNNQKKAFLFNGPITGNMGDHAILFAEEKFLKDSGINAFLVSSKEMNYFMQNNLYKKVKKNDNIYITGGGNTGSLWRNEQERINLVLNTFRDSYIKIFPQTIYYENDFFGKECLKKDLKYYRNCKNLIFECRDKKTFNFVNNELKINAVLTKDIALTLNYSNLNYKRDGILFCFRRDIEKIIGDNEKKELVKKILNETKIEKYKYIDTVITKKQVYSYRVAKKEFYKLIKTFAKSKLVVTDRLHGMIIAYITGTPCIAINNLSGKVKGVYDTICDRDKNIIFIENIKELEKEEEVWKKLKGLLNA